MGRTNPTYRDRLRHFEDDWNDYRRALRRRDTPHFDRLFDHARQFADAAGYANPDEIEVAVLLSILLAQERRLAALEEQLDHRDTSGCDSDADTGSARDAPGDTDDSS